MTDWYLAGNERRGMWVTGAVVPPNISIISHTAAGGAGAGSPTTTGAINTTGANFIVVAITTNSTTSGVVSDSNGNTWSQLTDPGGTPTNRLFYVSNPTVGSGHTFTCGSTANFNSIAVAAFSGLNATPFDVEASATGSSSTPSGGAIVPNQNNSLIVTSAGVSGDTLNAINSGFTITDVVSFLAGNHFGVGLAYLIQLSAASVTPIWTNGASVTWSATEAVFKP